MPKPLPTNYIFIKRRRLPSLWIAAGVTVVALAAAALLGCLLWR